ncbi:MAG: preprotein translocase subunit YajC [Clostridiales bacterium]|jgi:preprotein translocase subunit YajC|nr:preprotein translocase subunit YajC [Clostridiales bacterium]
MNSERLIFINDYLILLDETAAGGDASSSVIVGGQPIGTVPAQTAAAVAAPAQDGQTASTGGFGGAPIVTLLIYAAFIAAAYFIFLRPQRKAEKERKEMQAALKAGDGVLTTGGLYGKIVDVGEGAFMVEFGANKGVRVPVRKIDVVGLGEPKFGPDKSD